MLEVVLDARRVAVAKARNDPEYALAARVEQIVGWKPGLLAHLAPGTFGRRLAPAQRARHRLPKPARLRALEQQALARARVDHDEHGFRTLEAAVRRH